MLIGAYFVVKAGIATGVVFLAAASGILSVSRRPATRSLAHDMEIAGYIVSSIALIVYFGVIHA